MLLVDASGSMNGTKSCLAAATMHMLIRDFQKLVDLYVTTFNMRMIPIKQFGTIMKEHEMREKAELVVKEVSAGYGGGNHDNIALEEGFKILQKQKGEKIMMIVSDGQPACNCKLCGGHNLIAKTRDAAKMIERHNVPVLSVGIQTQSVKSIYKEYEIIQRPDQLYDGILKLLTRTVRRRAVKG
jgi:cobalamin biosynthesis protein CobT